MTLFPKFRGENDKIIFGERKMSILIKEKIINALPDQMSEMPSLISKYKDIKKQIKLELNKQKNSDQFRASANRRLSSNSFNNLSDEN